MTGQHRVANSFKRDTTGRNFPMAYPSDAVVRNNAFNDISAYADDLRSDEEFHAALNALEDMYGEAHVGAFTSAIRVAAMIESTRNRQLVIHRGAYALWERIEALDIWVA